MNFALTKSQIAAVPSDVSGPPDAEEVGPGTQSSEPETNNEGKVARGHRNTTSTRSTTGTVCFDYFTLYTDSGIGEDYWTNFFPTARAMRGISWAAYNPVTLEFESGFLGDGMGAGDPGAGCADLGEGIWIFGWYSDSFVNGNFVEAVDEVTGDADAIGAAIEVVGSQTTNYLLNDPIFSSQFNVAMAGVLCIVSTCGRNDRAEL